MLYRLRNDFQLSVISLLGVFAILGIPPFAVWRFVQGETLIGTKNRREMDAALEQALANQNRQTGITPWRWWTWTTSKP